MYKYILFILFLFVLGALLYALGQKDCQNQHLTTHQEQQDHVIRKNLKFMHAPILTATLCLNSCATHALTLGLAARFIPLPDRKQQKSWKKQTTRHSLIPGSGLGELINCGKN